MKLISVLYGVVVFLSAFLLFLLEPMAARRILPLFGGSAAVWTTCLAFFQVALLAGYFYAHALVSRLRPAVQSRIHIALLTAAIVSLKVQTQPNIAATLWHPISSILEMLAVTIGLSFVALAATTRSCSPGIRGLRLLRQVPNGASLHCQIRAHCLRSSCIRRWLNHI